MILSICIATYNHAAYLDELLQSIFLQNMGNIDVVVGDDASSDNTRDIVESYRARLPGLRYIRHEVNLGPDRNFLFVVAMASGKFVWLIGDDDRLAPGALRVVVSALEHWPDVCGLTPGVIDYDSSLTRPTGIRHMPETTRLQGVEEVFQTIIDLLGFISVTIVNRQMWLEACQSNPVTQYMNKYIQVYIIACMVGPLGFWGVLNVPCIHYRTNNDQTLLKIGWFNRLKLDVVSYDQIINGVMLANKNAVEKSKNVILRTHIMSRIYNAKVQNVRFYELVKTIRFLRLYYGNSTYFWIYTIPVILFPNNILKIMRSVYQTYSSNSGANRAKSLLRDRFP